MKVILNEQQEKLREEITEYLMLLKGTSEMEDNKIDELYEKMALAAHTLHMQLEPKPKHPRYMIKNRGVDPEDKAFYDHIHPVEDLLSYLDDTSANDDPVDLTLNGEFYMNIYTRRWGHDDRYKLVRNSDGWYVDYLTYQGQAGRDAEPMLSDSLKHDSVSYPRNLDLIMEDIWVRAQDEGLTHEKVQEMLNEVADWISITERNYPEDISR